MVECSDQACGPDYCPCVDNPGTRCPRIGCEHPMRVAQIMAWCPACKFTRLARPGEREAVRLSDHAGPIR